VEPKPNKWERVRDLTHALHAALGEIEPRLDAGEVLSVAAGLFQTAIVNTARANAAPDQIAELRVVIHATLARIAAVIDQPDAAAITAAALANHRADAFVYGPAPVAS
jgi:hypothetical protein